MEVFAEYLRARREALKREKGGDYSLKAVAARIGVAYPYLSQIETGVRAPSEDVVRRLATDLAEDPERLVEMARGMSTEMERLLRDRADIRELVKALKEVEPAMVKGLIRQVRDGDW